MSKIIHFGKYEALGNDFVIVEGPLLSVSQRQSLCDRNFGVGADGVITLLKSPSTGQITMHVTNADGSEAAMCGNGLRCVAVWLLEQGLVQIGESYEVETASGPRIVTPTPDGAQVDMGFAEFLENDNSGVGISMGNPHFVLTNFPPQNATAEIGADLEQRNPLGVRANIEFVRTLGDNRIEMTVWERGVGFTKACGSGACAAVAALVHQKELSPNAQIIVQMPGGEVEVATKLETAGLHLWLKGPSRRVFEGKIEI